MITKKNKLIQFILSCVFIFIVFLQLFLDSGYYSIVRVALYGLVAFLLVLVVSGKKNIITPVFLFGYGLAIFLSCLSLLFISLIKNELVTDGLFEFVLVFFVVYMGIKIKIDEEKMNQLIMLFLIATTFVGIYITLSQGDGFEPAAVYLFAGKNQLGVFFGTASLASFVSLINQKIYITNRYKIILFFILVINFLNLIIIRNRSSLVALMFCLVFVLLSKIKLKKIYNKSILLLPVVILLLIAFINTEFFYSIANTVYESLTLNFDTSDLNALSANRTDDYLRTLLFLKESPFFGEIINSSRIIGTPHNYLLNLWLNYGVLGMLPMTVFYIYMWIEVIKEILFVETRHIGVFLTLFILFISLFEYSYPFAPLTAVFFSWFMFGRFLRERQLNKQLE